MERFDLWRDAVDAQSVHFRVVCSKGTYIRSLAHDLGHAVGSAAHLTALRREAIGEYEVEGAWGIQELADGLHQQRLERKQDQNAAEAAEAAAAGEQPAAAEGVYKRSPRRALGPSRSKSETLNYETEHAAHVYPSQALCRGVCYSQQRSVVRVTARKPADPVGHNNLSLHRPCICNTHTRYAHLTQAQESPHNWCESQGSAKASCFSQNSSPWPA